MANFGFDIEENRRLSRAMLKAYSDNPMLNNNEPRALYEINPADMQEIGGRYYIRPGFSSASNPIYNRNDLIAINRGNQSIREVPIQPAKRGRGRPKKESFEGAGVPCPVICKAAPVKKGRGRPPKAQGAGIKSTVKKAAKTGIKAAKSKTGRAIIGTTLDIGVPIAAAALGQLAGVPLPAGAIMGKVARETFRHTTGFGGVPSTRVLSKSIKAPVRGRVQVGRGATKKVKNVLKSKEVKSKTKKAKATLKSDDTKKIVGKALDIGLPILSEAVTAELGIDKKEGKAVAVAARKGIQKETGFGGRKPNASQTKARGEFGAKMASRRAVVRRIMIEKKLPYKAASAYVKSQGIAF